MGRYDIALDKNSDIYQIHFHFDMQGDILVIESDKDGLTQLKSMIDRKIKLKDNSTEILIAKNKKGQKYKIRFDLI